MKRFGKYIFYLAVAFLSLILCVVFYRDHPDVQAVFYIPAVNVLLYSIIADNLFPYKNVTDRKRQIQRSRQQF
ncbi:hypothetical protein LJ707_19880 [Mucilaginibacter sp. UR6-1]|uniref:hypothetical protein n=1 Tax=Mucilaginibacter sp. UR6-1 TaxID=1435643 RepID=UPI001E2F54BF|nr:hypothetical protein [Mucilaginibacter sp. UR6-1]MCC8411210.1 hypothetical protein [Mucilaginibacter sp. UR6-1]